MSVKKNIASCLEPVTVNYVSVWFCASHVWKPQYCCRHINCWYCYPLTCAHDYVATDQRFLPHFPLSDLMFCNFLISDWDVLLGYLIKSFAQLYVCEMLHAELVISSLHEVCLFWISFSQPSVRLHHYFWLSHPITWLVLAMPCSVHTVWPMLFKPVIMETSLLSTFKVFVLSTALVQNKAIHTWSALSHGANSEELLTKNLARPLYPFFHHLIFPLVLFAWML